MSSWQSPYSYLFRKLWQEYRQSLTQRDGGHSDADTSAAKLWPIKSPCIQPNVHTLKQMAAGRDATMGLVMLTGAISQPARVQRPTTRLVQRLWYWLLGMADAVAFSLFGGRMADRLLRRLCSVWAAGTFRSRMHRLTRAGTLTTLDGQRVK